MSAAVAPEAPRRVLVINVSRIGDTLLATPAMRAIASAWPAAELTVLGHPKRVEILRHLPFIANVGAIDKRRAPWLGRLGGVNYDLAFVYGFDPPLIAYALRVARRVVAFRQSLPEIDARLFRAVEVPAFQSEHSVLQLLRLPQAVGVRPAGLRLSYAVTQEERAAALARLRAANVASAAPLVGLQVASFPTKAYRDWPVESFTALCRGLLAAHRRARFLIFGGSEEQARTTWLARELRDQAVCFAGRLTLRETAAVMSCTNLYVGVDTGPTHIMSCFDIPLVGLYHGFSPSWLIGPREHPCAYLVDHPRAGPGCPTEVSMAEISVDAVLQQALLALAQRRSPRAACTQQR